ncbi:MAG: tetratricopeptide repeat protein, partial [Candidatus Korobacteraceae bacterium]
MFALSHLFYPWGLLLQGAAILHFIRRRPDTYWLWIILIGGGLGSLVYLAVEALPDVALLKDSFGVLPRRQRIRQLQALVEVNPAPANYEELGDLYLQNGQYAKARECFDRAITSRSDTLDPHYRRALAAIGLGDYRGAIPDLEKVVRADS